MDTQLSTVTLQQLWQTPNIKGVYSQIASPSLTMSGYYGVMENTEHAPVGTFGFDLFDRTRTVGTFKAPQSIPSTITKQRVGHRTGALLRYAEKLNIYDADIRHLRPLGSPIGTLTEKGEEWATRQMDFLLQRHKNAMEIMTSKAIQGGFGLARSGEMYYITELNASGNEFNLDFMDLGSSDANCRTRHTGTLDGIIDKEWSDPTADIIGQLQTLQQRMLYESGVLASVCWTDSRTIKYMMMNRDLQSVNGIANRVWQSWNANEAPKGVEPGGRNLGGQRIVFGAIPQWTFMVNDAVVALGTSSNPQGSDSYDPTEGTLTRVVPAGHVLFTPPPSPEWLMSFEGEEVVRKSYTAESEVIKGMGAYNFPIIQPPGREMHVVDNRLIAVRMPRQIWNATVRTKEADEIG